MPINMSGYKMIYKNVIYNLLQIEIRGNWDPSVESESDDIIIARYIDENNRVKTVKDKNEEFQFVAR